MKNSIIRIKVLGKLKRHLGDYLHLEKMNQHISESMFRSLHWVSKGFNCKTRLNRTGECTKEKVRIHGALLEEDGTLGLQM